MQGREQTHRGAKRETHKYSETVLSTAHCPAHKMKSSRSSCRRADSLTAAGPLQTSTSPLFIRTSSSRLCPVCSPFYVIIFFQYWICVIELPVVRPVHVCVWARTLCKCRSFQTPIGVQSPNQLTAQVLILSAHKLLLLFLISNEHICTDICFFISFLSHPQEEM